MAGASRHSIVKDETEETMEAWLIFEFSMYFLVSIHNRVSQVYQINKVHWEC